MYSITIISKDNKNLKYIILDDDTLMLFDKINDNLPKNAKEYYNFAYEYKKKHHSINDCWDIYDPLKEYTRQGINLKDGVVKFLILEFKIQIM